MANVQSKENMTISIREYKDGQGNQKKVWKTIGELITWDDGSKSFELWGPTGSTKGNVFAKDNDNQSNNQGQQSGFQQDAPQQQNSFNQGTNNGQQPPAQFNNQKNYPQQQR